MDSLPREKGSATGSCLQCGGPVGVVETRPDGSDVLAECTGHTSETAAEQLPREHGTNVKEQL
jgi:hypothetical protein